MRILIASEMSVPYATGGGETRYALLARQLAADGHDVTWLSMRQRDSPDEERIDGVRRLHRGPRLVRPPLRPLHQKLHFMAVLFAHLLRHRYDIVDCQSYAPLPAAWLATRLRRMPMVASIHDTSAPQGAQDQWLSGFDRALAGFVEARLYRLGYEQVLTCAPSVREDFIGRFGLPANAVSAVAPGIDVAAVTATPPHPVPCDIVFVGRLIPHKHPEQFLELARRLDARRAARGQAPLRARVVGTGPLQDELVHLAAMPGMRQAPGFTGEVARHEDVIAHIRSARVLVLPSTREGFGLVLVEAMAGGVAVAAYDLPAVRETLGPELAAQALAPPGEVEALAGVVERLLDDGADRARHLAAGRARAASNFDLAPFARGVMQVYERVLAAFRR